MNYILTSFFLSLIILIIFPTDAHAYLDPATGAMIIQALIAAFVGITFFLKKNWQKLKQYFNKNKSETIETNTESIKSTQEASNSSNEEVDSNNESSNI
jgi:O-antigen/teichoic acid export membrane protein